MNKLKNRLTNLLALNRGVFNRIDSTAQDHPAPHALIVGKDQVTVEQPESQQAANDNNGRPDWFQAIHGTDS